MRLVFIVFSVRHNISDSYVFYFFYAEKSWQTVNYDAGNTRLHKTKTVIKIKLNKLKMGTDFF